MPGSFQGIRVNSIAMFIQFQNGENDVIDDQIGDVLGLLRYTLSSNTTTREVLHSLGSWWMEDEFPFGSHTLVLTVMTPYAPGTILRILHNLLLELTQRVMGVDEATFTKIRNGYLGMLAAPPANLDDFYGPIRRDFRSRRFTFDWLSRTRNFVSNLDWSEFRHSIQRHADTSRKLYVQVTRTDGQEDRDISKSALKGLVEQWSFPVALSFDRIWEGPEIPSSFQHAALHGRHTSFTESVPECIPFQAGKLPGKTLEYGYSYYFTEAMG